MPLYRVKFGEEQSSTFVGEQANKWKLCCNSASIWRSSQLRQPCVNSHWFSQWEALGTSHFLPLTKSTYHNRSLKKLSQVITSTTSTAVQNLAEIPPCGASGQIGELLTIFRFLFIPLFKQRTYSSDLTTFSCLMAQMTWTHARVCLFGFGWYCSPYRGSKCPKTPILQAWIGIFQPNVPNIEMFIL